MSHAAHIKRIYELRLRREIFSTINKSMEQTILSVGIDIAQLKFDVCIMQGARGSQAPIKGSTSFPNTAEGFGKFYSWVQARTKLGMRVTATMEATGSYYESLAYFLHGKGIEVCVEHPSKVKYYAKSLNIKGKTDKIDAAVIAALGISRELRKWEPMAEEFRVMRDIQREIRSLKDSRTAAKNQMHAICSSHGKSDRVSVSKQKQIEFYENAIADLQDEAQKHLSAHPDVKKRVACVTSAKGIGLETALSVIGETGGFESFGSISQLVSYAGLDPVQNESGKHKGRATISKRGNKRLRTCLYMPALVAGVHNEKIKEHKDRIVGRNPNIKLKGTIASMRKLLILIYVLWKKQEMYDPGYVWGKTSGSGEN